MGKLKWYVLLALIVIFSGMASAEQLYVNESGWWREGGVFNASGAPIQVEVDVADTFATWIIAIFTAVYTIAFMVTVVYIAKQLKENKLLREATVLKEVYDYIIRTHKFRKIIYSNENKIEAIRNVADLETMPEVSEAIHEVANCYHYIGFLLKYGMLTNKLAIFEEGGDTFLHIYEIIKPVIEQERARMGKETYKQYLEYLVEEINKYKS